ncbi:hypothetical protein Gotur_026502, partial [Gossypium turneri]
MTKRGRFQLDWGIKHRKFVALWNDRLRRIPQMVMATNPQPSLEYIQWYYSCGKPYILGGQSTIIPLHVQQLRGSDATSPIDPELRRGEYAYEFELFGSYLPQYGMSGPSNPYPQHHGTYFGSSSSAANEPQDFSSMFATPPPASNDDVGR